MLSHFIFKDSPNFAFMCRIPSFFVPPFSFDLLLLLLSSSSSCPLCRVFILIFLRQTMSLLLLLLLYYLKYLPKSTSSIWQLTLHVLLGRITFLNLQDKPLPINERRKLLYRQTASNFRNLKSKLECKLIAVYIKDLCVNITVKKNLKNCGVSNENY